MRLRNLILGDIQFQYKYGFYFVYIILTILYICLLNLIPEEWSRNTAGIMIFSDPAAMGLFFMGAIILLEKSQRVIESVAVTPVKVSEYIISKVLSLGLISTVTGIIIAASAGSDNLYTVVLGTFFGSVLFSLLGLLAASKISSLNQFLLLTVPIELVSFLPAIIYLMGYQKSILLLHPGCIIIRFLLGNNSYLLPLIILLFIWIGILYLITYYSIKKMFTEVGGVKL